MNLKTVQRFMLLPTDRNNWEGNDWELIRDRSAFLCVDWGEETEEILRFWNDIVGVEYAVTASDEETHNPTGFTHRLTYRGRMARIPYIATGDDCFIAVLALNALVKEDIDMRFCKDSVGNSDLCFLPLFPNDWLTMEASFGAKALDNRFQKLPVTFQEFSSYLT